MKTFQFGLFLMAHILVFHLNNPKSMNLFYNFRIFGISCVKVKTYLILVETGKESRWTWPYRFCNKRWMMVEGGERVCNFSPIIKHECLLLSYYIPLWLSSMHRCLLIEICPCITKLHFWNCSVVHSKQGCIIALLSASSFR